MFSKSAVAVATVLGTSLVGAHLVMVDPVPYNFDSSDNSPLDADGSNFPCKITGDYTVTEENYMVKGETQSMTFHGGTTHGGGSCQISITSDRAPSNSTTWDVIMSIEGGCMDETESDSNIGTSATMVTPFSPNFTIPDSFDAGEYTIAWTWFNRIGSREMYMNCAPITITESSSSKKRSESAAAEKRSSDEFPDLFIANINGCLTEEMYDIRFPNPGDTVEYLGPSSHLIATDADVCYSGSATWGTAGYSTATASSSTQSSSTATTAITTAEASVSTSLTVAVSSQTTEAVQATETAQTTEITPTTTTSVASETSAADTSSGSSSASSSSSEALTGSCSQEGYWNCISGTSFQRCAGGIWTPSQPMPAGTECNAGQSEELAINAVSVTSQTLSEKHLRTHKNGRRGHR
ncbi:hypothetical protein N7462_008263 [Penicillium macrosclerotiorum]|uniref:uncharacterized protein n=1 Tax=Penicillium macrosclerotiorum TaxID=303699 RepID=UPI002546816B|nr:uncharacterized protein N7462_008263 [Penicillium macrosclerotiorum]KAJ5675366.1 hypothetical protein N7462_008263 [Penicillium macrosclerotiorum]